MGTAGRSAPLRRTGSLLGLLGLEVAALVGLHWLGRFEGLRIAWDAPVPWLLSSPVQEVLGALLRTVALVMAYWLLASTLLYLLASLTRLPSAVRAVRWATLPVVRRVADHAVAVTLATSMVGGGTLGAAGPALAADRGRAGPPARKPVAAAQATDSTAYGFDPADQAPGSGTEDGTSSTGSTTTTTESSTTTTSEPTTTSKATTTTGKPTTTSESTTTTSKATTTTSKPTTTGPTTTTAPTTTSTTLPPTTTTGRETTTTTRATTSTTRPETTTTRPAATTTRRPAYVPTPADQTTSSGTTTSTTPTTAPPTSTTTGQRPPAYEFTPATPSTPEKKPPPESSGGKENTGGQQGGGQEAGQERRHEVVRSDNLWSIAKERLAARGSGEPTNREVSDYWVRVVEANEGHLRSGNPDLIYPGEEVILPPLD
jgi:hypothetical protein